MRLIGIVASVVSASALLVLAACSDQTSDAGGAAADDDAGTTKKPGSSSSSGSSGDPNPTDDGGTSSSSSGGTKPVGSALANQPVVLWGITDDGMVVYQPLPATQGAASSLEAIPLVGGTKTTIVASLADSDVVSVSGGAVGWWTSVTGGLGTFNVWTKANGPKTAIATGSIPDIFAASSDGSRIAFSVSGQIDNSDPANPTPSSTSLAVTGSASPSATAIKYNATTVTMDLASQTCAPDTAFAGNVFLSGHCAAGVATPHLFSVSDTGAVARLDGTSSTTTVKPMVDGTFWSADATGAKVFALVGTAKNGSIFNGSGTALASKIDNTGGILEGLMQTDGSAVVYRNATTIMRGTAVASPVTTTLLAGATPKSIQALSKDGNRLLFNTLDPPASGAPLIDIRAIDTTSASQTAVDIVATGTAYPLGFTGDSAHVLYYTDVGASGVTLKTKPPAGGTEATLATNILAARPARAGTGVLIRQNKQTDATTGLSTYDLLSIDAAAAGTPKPIASGVPSGLYDISGSKLVYVTFDKTYPGLYVTSLP